MLKSFIATIFALLAATFGVHQATVATSLPPAPEFAHTRSAQLAAAAETSPQTPTSTTPRFQDLSSSGSPAPSTPSSDGSPAPTDTSIMSGNANTPANPTTPTDSGTAAPQQPTTTDLNSKLNTLTAVVGSIVSLLPSLHDTDQPQLAAAQFPQQVAADGNAENPYAAASAIGQLNGTTLANVTVNGVSGLTASEIPDLSGSYLPLSGGTLTGLGTFGNGFLSQASSTVIGNLTVTGAFNGGSLSLSSASTSMFSAYGPVYFGGTATSTFGIDGSLTLAKALGVASGGTGWATINSGSILFGNGSSALATSSSLFWDNTDGWLGIGSLSPQAPIWIGNQTTLTPDAAIVIARDLTGSGLNGHAFEDSSVFARGGSTDSYNSFDARPSLNVIGTDSTAHYNAFQARPIFNASTTLSMLQLSKGWVELSSTATGTITNLYSYWAGAPQVDSGSTARVTNWYGLFVDYPNASVTNSWGLYVNGLQNWLQGNLAIGNIQAPTTQLEISSPLTATSSGITQVELLAPVSGSSAVGSGSRIVFGANNFNNTLMADIRSYIFAPGNTGLEFGTGYGNVTPRVVINGLGAVGIGTTSPSARLTVWGPDTASTTALNVVNSASTTVFAVYDSGNSTYSGSIFLSSDQRLKTNIQPLDTSSSFAAIEALNPVSYTRIDQAGQGINLGFIAQQVQQIFPQLVSTTSPTALTPDGTLTLNYTGLIAPIVGAIQDIASISSTFQSNLIAWLGNASNGIQDLFATNLYATKVAATEVDSQQDNTQKLCLSDTPSDPSPVCLTKSQLAALLSAVATPVSPISVTSSGDISVQNSSLTSTATSTPPVLQINGDNPAIVQVGATYQDLGATVTGPQQDLNLGIQASVDGGATTTPDQIQIDTSEPGTHTLLYSATDQNGFTGTATRTAIVQATASTTPSATTTNRDATTTATFTSL